MAVSTSRVSVHFSSATSEWATPQWLFDALNREFGFTLDPCSTDANAKCKRHYTRQHDGLQQSWKAEIVFMNPPYGQEISSWMAKAQDAATRELATVVCLVPARTDTAWWHSYAMKHEIRLLKGRLRFGDGHNSAPFPSAVIVMRPVGFFLESMTLTRSGPCVGPRMHQENTREKSAEQG
jgi:phage N-6-adenine-methyltransferase